MPNITGQAREARLRRLARRQGFMVRKSRARNWNLDNQCGFMIIDRDRNSIEAGERFDLDLDDVQDWLTEIS